MHDSPYLYKSTRPVTVGRTRKEPARHTIYVEVGMLTRNQVRCALIPSLGNVHGPAVGAGWYQKSNARISMICLYIYMYIYVSSKGEICPFLHIYTSLGRPVIRIQKYAPTDSAGYFGRHSTSVLPIHHIYIKSSRATTRGRMGR